MAEAAILPAKLVAYTNSDWNEEPWEYFNGALTTPDNLTGASAKMALRLTGQTVNAVEFTTDNSELTITLPNEIGITVPLSIMSTLTPGLYNFDLVVTYASGDIETVTAGQAQIVGGISI